MPENAPETSKSKKKKPVNSPDNFSDKWAPEAARFLALIQRLKDDKWTLIFNASGQYIIDVPNAGAGPYLKVVQQEAEKEKKSEAQGEMKTDVTEPESGELANEDILLSD